MNVTFASLTDYLEELRSAPQGAVVRTSVSASEVNAGVEAVTLVSGWHDGVAYYYELRLTCGENWKGGEPQGTLAAQDAAGRIKQACEQCGLKHRGGRWQRT